MRAAARLAPEEPPALHRTLGLPVPVSGAERLARRATLPRAASASAAQSSRGLSATRRLDVPIERTMDELRRVRYFHGCSDAELRRLAGATAWELRPRYQVILHEGTACASKFFVITSGHARVTDTRGREYKLLAKGDTFGESALIAPGRIRRNASVVAQEDTVLLAIDTTDVAVGAALKDVERVVSSMMTQVLNVLPHFRALDDEAILQLSQVARTEKVKAGARLFSAGDHGDTFYIVLAGVLELRADEGAVLRVITPRSTNAYVGELALFLRRHRLATAVAQTELTVLALAGRDFRAAVAENEAAREQVLRNAVTIPRLAQMVRINIAEVGANFDLPPGDKLLRHLQIAHGADDFANVLTEKHDDISFALTRHADNVESGTALPPGARGERALQGAVLNGVRAWQQRGSSQVSLSQLAAPPPDDGRASLVGSSASQGPQGSQAPPSRPTSFRRRASMANRQSSLSEVLQRALDPSLSNAAFSAHTAIAMRTGGAGTTLAEDMQYDPSY